MIADVTMLRCCQSSAVSGRHCQRGVEQPPRVSSTCRARSSPRGRGTVPPPPHTRPSEAFTPFVEPEPFEAEPAFRPIAPTRVSSARAARCQRPDPRTPPEALPSSARRTTLPDPRPPTALLARLIAIRAGRIQPLGSELLPGDSPGDPRAAPRRAKRPGIVVRHRNGPTPPTLMGGRPSEGVAARSRRRVGMHRISAEASCTKPDRRCSRDGPPSACPLGPHARSRATHYAGARSPAVS